MLFRSCSAHDACLLYSHSFFACLEWFLLAFFDAFGHHDAGPRSWRFDRRGTKMDTHRGNLHPTLRDLDFLGRLSGLAFFCPPRVESTAVFFPGIDRSSPLGDTAFGTTGSRFNDPRLTRLYGNVRTTDRKSVV